MNPVNPLMFFMFSVSTETAWGAQYRAPDDDHPEPWVPDWALATWPADTVIGPQHPSNLPGYDNTKHYKPVFNPLGWEEIDPPPVSTGRLSEESSDGLA